MLLEKRLMASILKRTPRFHDEYYWIMIIKSYMFLELRNISPCMIRVVKYVSFWLLNFSSIEFAEWG